ATSEFSAAVAAGAQPTEPTAEVVGRHLFYNHSVFDGNDRGANAADDAAVAPDKVALLPGQSATFDNVSNYARGINGVIVDVRGMVLEFDPPQMIFEVCSGVVGTAWSSAPTT